MDVADLSSLDVVLRLLGAAFLGALVGLERESAGQDAGFRTHVLLAVGAALFSVASVGAFDAFITRGPTNVQVDVTRIASYVPAGVGFIGGGVILKSAGGVRGVTTAASLWVAAAIGLSAGLGFWAGAIAATVLALTALYVLKPISDRVGAKAGTPALVIALESSADSAALGAIVERCAGPDLVSVEFRRRGGLDGTEVVVHFDEPPSPAAVSAVAAQLAVELGDDLRSVAVRPD